MLHRQGLRTVFLLAAFFDLSSRYALAEDPNFDLGGKAGKTNAIVQSKEFQLKVAVGSGYQKGEDKTFKLLIGGCPLKITAGTFGEAIMFQINGVDLVPGLRLITANSTSVKFTGSGTSNPSVGCEVDFGNKIGDVYYVSVELSGDVPSGFKLYSTDVKMGGPDSKNEANEAKLGAGAIAGIIAAVLVGFLAVGSIVGFIFYRLHRNKVLRNTQVGDRMNTTKSLEQLPTESKTPDPASTQAASTVDSKTMKPKENNEAPAKASKEGGSEVKTESTKSVKKISKKSKDNKKYSKDKVEKNQKSSKIPKMTREKRSYSSDWPEFIVPDSEV